MSTTDGTMADQYTPAADDSSEAGGSNLADHDTTRPTSPLLSAYRVDDEDDAAVLADRQEQEANSRPARTAARFLSSQTRRHSERSILEFLSLQCGHFSIYRNVNRQITCGFNCRAGRPEPIREGRK